MKPFTSKIEVRWADADANRHVRHSSFYDYGAHVRIRFFDSIGFHSRKLAELNLGPILFKEECTFLKEVRIEQNVEVRLSKGEINADGSKWSLHHEIFNEEETKCAHLTVWGSWMDLGKRKLTKPPVELLEALRELPQGEIFVYQKKK